MQEISSTMKDFNNNKVATTGGIPADILKVDTKIIGIMQI